MQTEFIAVPPFWTVGQTIDFMRDTADLPETFYEIFVIDPPDTCSGRWPSTACCAASVRSPSRRSWTTSPTGWRRLSIRRWWRAFERYNFVSAAVVDEANRLVGVMMVDDIVDVLEEEADADIKQLGGVKSDEELSDTVLYTQRSRFPGSS